MKNDHPLRAARVAVIGLDCAPAELVLKRWRKELPNLNALRESGFAAVLNSTIPPITIPAWSCMLSGRDPGELGLYGFRNRVDYSYGRLALADSQAMKLPRVWDLLSQAEKRCIVLGVPQTYPPAPLNGLMVSCFLTPSKEVAYTYPRWLKDKIDAWAGGEYLLDVDDFRTDDKERLLVDIRRMTRARFQLASRLLDEDWDFFMMVEMGIDRIQHGFWRFMDPGHRLYDPLNPYREVIKDYYREIDTLVGGLLAKIPDDSLVLVVSDHGAKSMQGAVAINQWLLEKGYLFLKDPDARGPLKPQMVDWSQTRAWGEGGYYARLFFNIKGREPQGVLEPKEIDHFRREITALLEEMPDHEGRPLENQVFAPQDIYREIKGIPPDLIVYLGGLAWRSLGSLGHDRIHVFKNDTGPDDANHSPQGIIIGGIKGRHLPVPPGGRLMDESLSILGVAPTILNALGVETPVSWQTRAFDFR